MPDPDVLQQDVGAAVRQPVENPEEQKTLQVPDDRAAWVISLLYDFENREGIFPAVHRSYKFCLLTMGGPDAAPEGTDFAFFLTNTAQLHESDHHFKLSSEDIALLNPNTRT